MKRYFVLLMLLVWVIPKTLKAQGFRYPIPSDSILDRHGRVTYMLEHFWDEQNIADTTAFKNPKFMLDYLYLLKQVSDEEKYKYIASFVMSVSNYDEGCGNLFWLLDRLLYDSSSSHYNEDVYRNFLEAFMVTDIDASFKSHIEARLNIVRKNRIGRLANDFSFIDKQGTIHRLYEIDTPLLLLIFNNPDCSLCKQTEDSIDNNNVVKSLLKSDSLKILAITSNVEYNKWIKHAYPKKWILGVDIDERIYTTRLYDIQRLPSIYLLDNDKRVLLKEADYERLDKYLSLFK